MPHLSSQDVKAEVNSGIARLGLIENNIWVTWLMKKERVKDTISDEEMEVIGGKEGSVCSKRKEASITRSTQKACTCTRASANQAVKIWNPSEERNMILY